MLLPEYASFQAFVQFLHDDERSTFTAEDLQALNRALHVPVAQLRSSLEEDGFTLEPRQVIRQPRGFTTSSNDRWYGPGSDKTHGGTGF